MAFAQQVDLGATLAEFEKVALGDERLERRLLAIISQLAGSPAESFPQQMRSTADREALYRFLSNPKVSAAGVLGGHLEQSYARVKGQPLVRVVHDTTSFTFAGERDGLGIVEGQVRGFFGHFALAVGADERREPFGIVGLLPHVHQDTVARRGRTDTERVTKIRATPRDEKESSRWEKLAQQTSTSLPDGVQAIHIMDQEADDFALLANLHAAGLRFVVRGSATRRTKLDGQSIDDVLASRPARIFRTVPINRRVKKTQRRHANRNERDAALSIRWSKVTLPRPPYGQTDLCELDVSAVHVFEPNPPAGAEPVDWLLLTSEPVRGLAEATVVVDHYRARWLIEEFFKALKTGCSFEKRQLTSYAALLRALSLFVPLAWRLLALRHLSRGTGRESARQLFSSASLSLLRVLLEQRGQYALPKMPCLRDAMLAIASIGGHIPNNGDPGWLVLGRGLAKFAEAEAVWCLALGKK